MSARRMQSEAEQVPLMGTKVDDVDETRNTKSTLKYISAAAAFAAACAFVGVSTNQASSGSGGLSLLGKSSGSGGSSSTGAKETITLVTGCSPRDLIYSLNFDPDTWTGKVGAKLITSGMSSEFLYEKALDMTEIGCGVYTAEYAMAPNATFGFFLYQVGNSTSKYMSDIGAQVENGPIKQSEIAAHAWANQNKASLENHLDSTGTLEQGEITDAEEDVQYSDLAAYRSAVESGHVDKNGHLVEEADPENIKLAPQMPAGYGQTEYYDWGAWLKYIVHGVEHSENQIECDPSANTCTLQHCSKWQCTDYTKPCQEGITGCTHPKDFMSEAKLGRLGTVKRYKNPKSMPVRRDPREWTPKEVREMKKKSASEASSSTTLKTLKKHGIKQVGERVILKAASSSTKPASKKSQKHSKTSTVVEEEQPPSEDIIETIVEDIADDVIVPTSNVAARAFHWDRSAAGSRSVRRALQSFPSITNGVFSYTPAHTTKTTPQLGLGRLYPSSLINYMADCNTKVLHTTNNGNANVEYYPRVNDVSNAGRVYIFGACFNSRDQNTCAVPSDTHPAGCKDATAGSQTNTNTATTTGNTQKGNTAEQQTVTTATAIEDETLSNADENGVESTATTSTATSATSIASQYTPITNENIHDAVAECLGYEPLAGECPESQYGVMSDWDVSRVTNMDQLFYDPPRIGGDKMKSFDGMLGNWDVSSVTSFEKMFKNANAFKGTNLYNWDVSSATNMHGMFEHAESFVARISGWNVGKVKTMATMFQNALLFNQPLDSWDVSSCKDFARMFSGVNEDGFAQDISTWNTRNDANMNNIFYDNSAYAAKFKCANADSGPPSSCRAKSVSEMIAEAMMGTNVDGKKSSKKHSSKRSTISSSQHSIIKASSKHTNNVEFVPNVHSTADSEAEDVVMEATEVARGGKSLFNKFGSLFGGKKSGGDDHELTYADYNDEELYGTTSQESEGFDATSEEEAGGEPEQQEENAEDGELGKDEDEEEEQNVDEWGEPLNKYDADPKAAPRIIRQTGHVDLFGKSSSSSSAKKSSSTRHNKH